MSELCQGSRCRAFTWPQGVLIFGGALHLLFAVWTNVWPFHGYDLFNLVRPENPILWQFLGLICGILGLALLLAARDPVQQWVIVLFALIKSAAVSTIVIRAVLTDVLPARSLGFLVISDLIWIPAYGYILWTALRARAGIPISRSQPYSVSDAAASYRLSTGQTLAEASAERVLALVFLRHFGCTFTRQILRGLLDLEQQARERDASLVLVHMLQSGQEIDYLGEHSEIPRIADPRCELYRAFGLGKGGFFELFGPRVWWRGMISVVKGCGVGHLAGDGLQMPGAFLFHQGKIIASQPANSAADLPDLGALFQQYPLEAPSGHLQHSR
jgi:hypothetical protein